MGGAPCGNLVTRRRKERPHQLSERGSRMRKDAPVLVVGDVLQAAVDVVASSQED